MIEIVVQGRVMPETTQVIDSILSSGVASRVIVSCWKDDKFAYGDERVTVLQNQRPANGGITNRNLQIFSSINGIKKVHGPTAAKFRSDQIITPDSIRLMNDFYEKYKRDEIIFVNGDFSLPFHPRDHVYWGRTQDLHALFDIPLDTQIAVEGEHYDLFTRSETYIAQFYYALHDSRVQKMIDNPREYLTDGSPKYHEAMSLSNELRDKVFKVFPRIDLTWPKHGIQAYKYLEQSIWERWHDEPW